MSLIWPETSTPSRVNVQFAGLVTLLLGPLAPPVVDTGRSNPTIKPEIIANDRSPGSRTLPSAARTSSTEARPAPAPVNPCRFTVYCVFGPVTEAHVIANGPLGLAVIDAVRWSPAVVVLTRT